jgi:hypothetical protein
MATRFVLNPGQSRIAAGAGQITGIAGGEFLPLPAGSTNIPNVSPAPVESALPGDTNYGKGTGFQAGFPIAYGAGETIVFDGAAPIPGSNLGHAPGAFVRILPVGGGPARASLLVGVDGKLPDGQRIIVIENGRRVPKPSWELVLLEG